MANTLISVAQFSLLKDAAVVDCRSNLMTPEAGRAAYLEGHIPSAQFADLNTDLSDPIEPGVSGRHPLPNKRTLTQTMRKLGIKPNQKVIAYDANTGAYAARLWWILRYLGHDQVWVLDGGYEAWLAAGNKGTSRVNDVDPSNFETQDAISQVISAKGLNETPLALIDARDEIRFRGEHEPIDPIAGHIPGAVCRPFNQNLDANGRFKSEQRLNMEFNAVGASRVEPSICYCGSGVTACHNILAMVHAGFPEPYLYPGSWSEWITDHNRPVAVGS